VNHPGFDAASILAKDADRAEGYPTEQRVRATRMALDRLDEYGSAWGGATKNESAFS